MGFFYVTIFIESAVTLRLISFIFMKHLSSLLFLVFAVSTGIVNGQSITIAPEPATHFCVEDPVAITFTVSGLWGHNNAFTLQLSDPKGGFVNGFQNIASIKDTLPGTFTINTVIPSTTTSTHYRLRILGAIPYIQSSDNGSDISIGTRPYTLRFSRTEIAGIAGKTISFQVLADGANGDSMFWNFGADASPSSFGGPVTDHFVTGETIYQTPGDKTVTLSIISPGGCSTTITRIFHIYDCSSPRISHAAIVIDSNKSINKSNASLWVNPGVHLNLNGNNDTVFAEAGSSIISSGSSNVFYMKRGSELTPQFYNSNAAIYATGASVPTASSPDQFFAAECPTLDFDYTIAPPNKAFPVDGVVNTIEAFKALTVSPNPTRGMISIQGAPSNDLNISVLNVLGEIVMQYKNPNTPDFTLDLSKLVAGTYYIRFSSANSVDTKKVIRN
jgi:hypothetical protein